MKKNWLILFLIILLITSCELFLGSDPDSSPQGIFDRIWTDFNEIYALFDIKGIDWDKTYQIYSPQIYQDMDDRELFRVCDEMLNTLRDAHVNLITPFDKPYYDKNVNEEDIDIFVLSIIQKYLIGEGIFEADGSLLYGTFNSNNRVGYIYIQDFWEIESAWKKIDDIIQFLAATDGLILDIRNNRGGFDKTMNNIAGRFVSVQKNYMKSYTKDGPGRDDFASPVTATIKPAGTRYTRPIVLLTNNDTTSAGEWFTLALRTQPHVTHAGGATCGALSALLVRPLINGWKYTLSVQKVTDMGGNYYEETGISPDEKHRIKNTWGDFSRERDTQLEYALKLLSP